MTIVLLEYGLNNGYKNTHYGEGIVGGNSPSKHSRKRECIPENGNKKAVKTL